ncbi:MAG TPA: SpoIIE family protein phosphatase [Acidimicrobiales bacterium]|nr:SpoIIE family protein phosphatase [Acidimicrobiales bacterium]
MHSAVVETCWRPMAGDAAGDFHDVIDLRDGCTAIVVGDAPGFGPRAAAIADQLRAEIRQAFNAGHDPVKVFEGLDGMLGRGEPRDEPIIATATCVVIDPASREVRLVNAGHLPPLLATTSGVEVVDGHADPLLGIAAKRRLHTRRLQQDATLFLYTDGLVERRGRSLDDSLRGLAELCAELTSGTAWASELARRALERFGEPADDVTVLSARITASRSSTPMTPVRLRVYVDRRDLRSTHTESLVRELAGRLRTLLDVRFEVVDVADRDVDVTGGGVMATPTVVRVSPAPLVRVVGNLTSVTELATLLQLPLPPAEN